MIIKKNFKKIPIIEKFINLFNKLIFLLGFISFLFILLVIIYFKSSGLNSPINVFYQVNDKVLNRYLGFDFRKTKDYLNILKLNFLSKFQSSDLEKVYLQIRQKSILGLEMQRKLRSENGGELPKSNFDMYPAKISYNGENYDVRIRTKGVRPIHWKHKNKNSYKVDIRGIKRLWGLEEFSLQKPIVRNYTYEFIFHELIGHVNLLRIKYFFVNLFLNDQDLGVYAVEEGFSKELIERQKKKKWTNFWIKRRVRGILS